MRRRTLDGVDHVTIPADRASSCILESEAGWRKSQLVRIRDGMECRAITAFKKAATIKG